ncbi:MAG: metal ABC transporter permease [Actinomycetota bacterium]|nr:metal ABC transporter permease [Actinomycetota bacterium]
MIDWITEPLSHGTALRALVEVMILGAVSGAVGCWVVLYGISYSAESLAHGLFPGLVGAALLGVPILLGGIAGIIAAALLITLVSRVASDSADTAIAVVVTGLFGLGVLMALSPDSPPGVKDLLFGDLLGATDSDLLIAGAMSATVIAVLWLFHDRLLAVGFDGGYGRSFGISPGVVTALLLTLVAVTILVAVQGLGNLLVAAILVAPAATARLVTTRLRDMILVSVSVALGAGIAGIYVSFHAKTAAGASVAACLVVAYVTVAAISAVSGNRFLRRATLNP